MSNPSQSRHGYIFTVAEIVLLFAIYPGTARFGLSLNAVSGFATLVWLPSGIGSPFAIAFAIVLHLFHIF